jgi:hypothetical protein
VIILGHFHLLLGLLPPSIFPSLYLHLLVHVPAKSGRREPVLSARAVQTDKRYLFPIGEPV